MIVGDQIKRIEGFLGSVAHEYVRYGRKKEAGTFYDIAARDLVVLAKKVNALHRTSDSNFKHEVSEVVELAHQVYASARMMEGSTQNARNCSSAVQNVINLLIKLRQQV